MKSIHKTSRKVLIVAIVPLVLASALTSCAGKTSSFVDQIVAKADANNDVVLPQQGSPSGEWDTLAVLCPYSLASDLPDVFQEAAEGIDTNSTDAFQWIFFESSGGAEIMKLTRESVDFCTSNAGVPLGVASTVWKASKIGSTWALSTAR